MSLFLKFIICIFIYILSINSFQCKCVSKGTTNDLRNQSLTTTTMLVIKTPSVIPSLETLMISTTIFSPPPTSSTKSYMTIKTIRTTLITKTPKMKSVETLTSTTTLCSASSLTESTTIATMETTSETEMTTVAMTTTTTTSAMQPTTAATTRTISITTAAAMTTTRKPRTTVSPNPYRCTNSPFQNMLYTSISSQGLQAFNGVTILRVQLNSIGQSLTCSCASKCKQTTNCNYFETYPYNLKSNNCYLYQLKTINSALLSNLLNGIYFYPSDNIISGLPASFFL